MNLENKNNDNGNQFTTGDSDFDRRFSDAQAGLDDASALKAHSEATNTDHASFRVVEGVDPNDVRRSGMWTEHDAMLADIERSRVDRSLRGSMGARALKFLFRRKK